MDERGRLYNAIGTAWLETDGTLKLDLQRSYTTRTGFHKILAIAPDNPRYQQYIQHLGGLEKGERKSIPEFLPELSD